MSEGITVRGVTFTYPGGETPILRGVDLTVAPGEFYSLIGPRAAASPLC